MHAIASIRLPFIVFHRLQLHHPICPMLLSLYLLSLLALLSCFPLQLDQRPVVQVERTRFPVLDQPTFGVVLVAIEPMAVLALLTVPLIQMRAKKTVLSVAPVYQPPPLFPLEEARIHQTTQEPLSFPSNPHPVISRIQQIHSLLFFFLAVDVVLPFFVARAGEE